MMNLKQFYTRVGDKVSFTREQASSFAKSMASDFNPIHDVTAKRFCVPGDLLFAVALTELGACKSMRFEFESMVTEKSLITMPGGLAAETSLLDQKDKPQITLHCSGNKTEEAVFIQQLVGEYVRFSGRTFPEILVGLMKDNSVMVNPARPLVIYKSMSVNIDQFSQGQLRLEFASASMDVDGKKGSVKLGFDLFVEGEKIGEGTKEMVVSGLRPYEQTAIDQIISTYNASKAAY